MNILVCCPTSMQVESVPVPVPGSVVRRCCECHTSVWSSPASLEAAKPGCLISCIDCAMLLFTPGQTVSEITPQQQAELAAYLRHHVPRQYNDRRM